jgi:hypothetical protein
MATIGPATITIFAGLGTDASNRRRSAPRRFLTKNPQIRREDRMNKIAIIAAAAVAAVSFGVGGALAQAGGDFAKADANKDGAVTQEEAMGLFPTLTADLFTKADANGDGKLDETEYAALQALIPGDTTQASSASSAAPAADTGTSSSSQASTSP